MLAKIESLDHEGNGVAHVDGKVVFIDGGITGETVEFSKRRSRGNFDLGTVTHVVKESPMRVTPRCPYFGNCGGCAMQHVGPARGSRPSNACWRTTSRASARCGMMLRP